MSAADFEAAEAEVRQFASLVRAEIADTEAEDRGDAGGAVSLWLAVYGSAPVSGRNLAEVAENAGRMWFDKTRAAAILAMHLAWRAAESEGKTAAEVLDEAEQSIAGIIRRGSGSTGIDQP